jgi:hypothetical protein
VVPLERQGEEPLILQPELTVEFLPQLCRLLAELGRPVRIARAFIEISQAGLGEIDVALDLDQRDGGVASVPSALTIASPESFHPWFTSPLVEVRWYSMNPSSLRSPWVSIHFSARSMFSWRSWKRVRSPIQAA